jgi:hypothetical protein
MKVLVGCEYSTIVRDAFRSRGHEAWSCDLLPCEGDPQWHIQGDVFPVIRSNHWDLIILHPPCTRLSVSGQWYVKRNPKAQEEQEKALRFTESLWTAAQYHSCSVALENPIGVLSTRSYLGKSSQIIQPYQYGEDASKATCLWLHNLPKLTPTQSIAPRMVNGKPRWANQTDSGQNRLPPSVNRWKDRSRTYQGIANAMANQWG